MKHVHNYQIVKQDGSGITEVCLECKKKLTTRQDSKGRINNRNYLLEHVRDTAQPHGRTGKIFKKVYGQGGT
jgi:hypothetical protein